MAQAASFLRGSPVFVLVTISPCFLSPPPFGGSATGRDSLESKVTFIQLSERVSPLECITDKDFTALQTAPRAAQIHPKTIYT